MTWIESNGAESVDQDKLYSLISNSFILDWIAVEDSFNFFLLLWETNHIYFFESAFDVSGNLVNIHHIVVGLIFKILNILFQD